MPKQALEWAAMNARVQGKPTCMRTLEEPAPTLQEQLQSFVFDPGRVTQNQIPDSSVHWNMFTKIAHKSKETNETKKADKSGGTLSDSLENSEKKGKRKHQPKKDWKLFPSGKILGILHLDVDPSHVGGSAYLLCSFWIVVWCQICVVESKIDNSVEWFEHLKSWLKGVTMHSNERSLLQRLLAAHQKLHLETIKSLHAGPKNKFDMLSDQIQTLLNLTSIRLQMVCDLILMLFGRNLCECHAQHTMSDRRTRALTHMGTQSRLAQDDSSFAQMLWNSISDNAVTVMSLRAADFTANGMTSGLLLFKSLPHQPQGQCNP